MPWGESSFALRTQDYQGALTIDLTRPHSGNIHSIIKLISSKYSDDVMI